MEDVKEMNTKHGRKKGTRSIRKIRVIAVNVKYMAKQASGKVKVGKNEIKKKSKQAKKDLSLERFQGSRFFFMKTVTVFPH